MNLDIKSIQNQVTEINGLGDDIANAVKNFSVSDVYGDIASLVAQYSESYLKMLELKPPRESVRTGDINEFIDTIGSYGGFAYNNLMEVFIENAPSNIDSESLRIVNLFCDYMQIPFPTFTEGKTFYNTYVHKMANGVDYDPVTLSFYVDKSSEVMKFFTAWLSSIHMIGAGFRYKNEYTTNIELNMLNENRNIFFTAKLINAYPTSIEPITLSFEQTEVVRIKMKFNFDYVEYNFTQTPFGPELPLTPPAPREQTIIDRIDAAEGMINKASGIYDGVISTGKSIEGGIENIKQTLSKRKKQIKRTIRNPFKN